MLLITTTGALMSRVPNRASVTDMPSARRWVPPAMCRRMRTICPSSIGNRAALFRACPTNGIDFERPASAGPQAPRGQRPDRVVARRGAHGGFFATLTSLSQGLVCQETTRNECLLNGAKPPLVRLDPALQRAVSFKIIGPRSSSAYRALLDEAGALTGNAHPDLGIWPNADGCDRAVLALGQRDERAFGLWSQGGVRQGAWPVQPTKTVSTGSIAGYRTPRSGFSMTSGLTSYGFSL